MSYGFRKSVPVSDEKKNRNASNDVEQNRAKFSSNLSRSRSAQSLKMLGKRCDDFIGNSHLCLLTGLGDSATQDDKLTILAQLFWLAVSLLESDYEHEFSLAVKLLARVMHRLPLDRPDARDKVEKLQQQLRWNNFPGVHALLLKVSCVLWGLLTMGKISSCCLHCILPHSLHSWLLLSTAKMEILEDLIENFSIFLLPCLLTILA